MTQVRLTLNAYARNEPADQAKASPGSDLGFGIQFAFLFDAVVVAEAEKALIYGRNRDRYEWHCRDVSHFR